MIPTQNPLMARRPKETRLALLKDINTRVTAAGGVSPDDMMITLYDIPGENISFGQGEAQRANASRTHEKDTRPFDRPAADRVVGRGHE
jgi:hypothetical protein